MAIDLSDLVESLEREISPPGSDLFPDATEDQLLGHLQDAFWEARLDGLLEGYTELEGIVSPSSGSTDITRDLQQLIVFYAGFRIIRSQLRDIKTAFRASAGPVSYETEQSANVLRAILDELVRRRNIILERLSDLGDVDGSYIDLVAARQDSLAYGDTYFVR